MSAGNPFSVSTTDNKSSDPSMEEILASIRRIIADDQGISGAPRASFVERSFDSSPSHTQPMPAHHEPSVQEPPAEPTSHASGALDAEDHIPAQHGSVAAPQYPMPGRTSEVDWSAPPIAQQMTPAGSPRVEEHVVEHRFTEPSSPEPEVPEAARAPTADPELEEDHYVYEEPTQDEQPYDQSLAMSQRTEPADAQSLFSAETDTSIASAFNMLAATRLADNSDELMNMVRDMIRPLLRSWLDDNLPTMVERMVRAEIERVARGGR